MLEDDVVVDDLDLEEEELDQEGNPFFDVLTSEDKEEQDDDDDGLEELEPQAGDSREVLETKLKAKNRILHQRAKTNSRLKDRVEELEAKLNSGNGGLSKEDLAEVLKAAKGGPDETKAQEQERLQALREKLEEDPTSIVDILADTNTNLENKLANILRSRDEYWEERIASMSKTQTQVSPEVKRLAGLLKQKDAYANLPEETLMQIAKDLAPIGAKVKRRPPATTTGRRVSIDASTEAVEKQYASELDAMGYGNE